MEQVVIIGGGHAAAEAVTALRQKGWQGEICLVSDEPHLPYQRPPLSKDYFSDKISSDSLAIKKQMVYDKTETSLKLGCRAVKINKEAQEVTLDNGETLHYSALIIATGTRPRKLPIPGADLPVVNYLRTLDDVTKIKSQLKPGARLLIVGAGYIGLEIAASALSMGIEVTVLETQSRVLARVTCAEMSQFYQDVHIAEGVDLRLNTGISAITKTDTGYLATLSNHEKIDGQLSFDVAIVGIGVLPNVELAREAGIECDNGILVDEFTKTSEENIFAVGDCCNHPNAFYSRRLRLESVPNAMEQAKTAAGVITGKATPYEALPWFWSNQYDIKLQTAGLSQGFDKAIVRGEPHTRKFCIFYLKDEQLLAVDAINSPQDFMKARQLIPQSFKVTAEKLMDISSPWFQ